MINLHGSIILYNRSGSSSSIILYYMYNTLFTVYCTIGVNTLKCY